MRLPISTRFLKSQLKNILNESTINHAQEIMNCKSWKDAHVYCVVNRLSSQQYGPLLEKYIINKYNFSKSKVIDCNGDISTIKGRNIELKVSTGGKYRNKFNYVQIRPFHKCDMYILTAYHLSVENIKNQGNFYIFKIPKGRLNQLLVRYGGYAHGTITKQGSITTQSLRTLTKDCNHYEYALRPMYNDKCWNTLLKYQIQEHEFNKI